jgi:hypothetical protein
MIPLFWPLDLCLNFHNIMFPFHSIFTILLLFPLVYTLIVVNILLSDSPLLAPRFIPKFPLCFIQFLQSLFYSITSCIQL